MALFSSARTRNKMQPNYLITYLPLALMGLCLMALNQALAHDRLAHGPTQSKRQPPAIYSFSSADSATDGSERLALASHRLNRPYSWTSQRLAKQLRLQEESNESAGQLTSSNLVSSAADDEGTERRRQMGDLALLYTAPQSANLIDAHHDKWPTKTMKTAVNSRASTQQAASTSRRRKPTSVETNRHGTKGRVGGSTRTISGTKRVAPPASRRHHTPPVALFPNPSSNATTSSDSSLNKRAPNKRKNLVCYYGTWAVYRPDAGKFAVENIDPFLCTHVIYGFTGLSYDNLIKPLDPWNDLEDNYGKGAMKRFTNLKRINPDLKTLVAIGGWNEGSIKYSKMASEPEARARFVQSVVEFLEKYNFDGLDLDWEYPGSRGGASYDKANFVRLLRELSAAFKPRNYLLTAAVSAGKWFMDPAYDVPQVSQYLDLINLMAYDYHGGWETKTGMNAPLFSSPKHDLTREEAMLNVNWSVNYWLAQGAAREKLMLGVGSYGRSFTLDKGQVNGINAPASQKGRAGPYTREPGSLGYNELCEMLPPSSSGNGNANGNSAAGWTVVRDPDYLAPYAYNTAERQWVGYDDRESLTLKAQFAKSMGLGGMMMWSIETDDFQGRCHNEKFPLLNTIRRVLDGGGQEGGGSGQVRPPQPQRPNTSASTTTTTTRRPSVIAVSTSTSRPSTRPPPPGEIEVEDQRPVASSTTRRPMIVTSTSRRPIQQPSSTSRRPQRPQPTTSTTSTSTTQRPSQTGEFVCRADGMFADPRNCRKFYRCVSQGNRFQTYQFDCAPGTAFNEAAQYCDYVYNVPSCTTTNRQLDTQTTFSGVKTVGESNSVALARQYYPNYFSHQFSVQHQWR